MEDKYVFLRYLILAILSGIVLGIIMALDAGWYLTNY